MNGGDSSSWTLMMRKEREVEFTVQQVHKLRK